MQSVLEYLEGEGAVALAKARNRSDQFGKQSGEMSALAKESRQLAEKLENQARNIRETAEKAFNTSLDASRISKDGLKKQANIRYWEHRFLSRSLGITTLDCHV